MPELPEVRAHAERLTEAYGGDPLQRFTAISFTALKTAAPPPDSAIGGTYVGNPVAQAAALAVLDVFEDEGLLERSQQIGERIRERMVSWQERFDRIGDVRGLGAMLALEFVEDRDTKEPDSKLATAVVEVMSDQPTSEKRTVAQLSGSAASADDARSAASAPPFSNRVIDDLRLLQRACPGPFPTSASLESVDACKGNQY